MLQEEEGEDMPKGGVSRNHPPHHPRTIPVPFPRHSRTIPIPAPRADRSRVRSPLALADHQGVAGPTGYCTRERE